MPYKEKIVVRGILQAGQPVNDIHISRTLPILAEFGDSLFAVHNAEGFISIVAEDGVNDMRKFPLRYQDSQITSANQRSLYRAEGLVAEAGKTYRLIVRWKDKAATATTTVPAPPVVVSARLIQQQRTTITTATTIPGTDPNIATVTDTVFVGEISVQAVSNLVYSANLQLVDTTNGKAQSTVFDGDALFVESAERLPRPILTTGALPKQIKPLFNLPAFAALARVFVFDEPYHRYILTVERGRQASSIFGGAGENVLWNVQGDGIGLFIGTASTNLILKR